MASHKIKKQKSQKLFNLVCLLGITGTIFSMAMVSFTSLDDIFFVSTFIFLFATIILGGLLAVKNPTKINGTSLSFTKQKKLFDYNNPTSLFFIEPLYKRLNKR